MAKYNIYGHVLYSEIQYEQLMYLTEKIFIQSLMNRIPDIIDWTDDIWNNIDHEYMLQTLEEIKRDVINTDVALLLKYKNTKIDLEKIIDVTKIIPDLFDISPITYFRNIETAYGLKVAGRYREKYDYISKAQNLDMEQYLTRQIKDWYKIEQTIPYTHKNGTIARMVTPSTYLSMLYNVNITRTGWNQSFKDADYFEKDLLILETHPRSCPLCAPMQGKIYSRTGKSKSYPSIEVAYEHGVGHPNCKCEFSIYWSPEQMKTQKLSKTEEGDYEEDQKKKAIEREIRKQENNLNLYNMIGNQEEVDKTIQKIDKLKEKL